MAVGLCFLIITQILYEGYHYYISRVACAYFLYRYLSLAFSDPGLASKNPIKIIENHRFCKTCQFHVRKFTHHCEYCDTCIEGYDHHCIFVGKCIGKKNFGQFKEFLCLIFVIMVYSIFISLTMASNVQKVGQK